MYIYVQSEKDLFTVGYSNSGGEFVPMKDCGSKQEALAEIHYLNGGTNVKLHQIFKLLEVLAEVLRRAH